MADNTEEIDDEVTEDETEEDEVDENFTVFKEKIHSVLTKIGDRITTSIFHIFAKKTVSGITSGGILVLDGNTNYSLDSYITNSSLRIGTFNSSTNAVTSVLEVKQNNFAFNSNAQIINVANNTGSLSLFGGSTIQNGGYLKLYGNGVSGDSLGGFTLSTVNASGTVNTLKGKSDGNLTWSGTLSVPNIYATSDKRLKENIVQYCENPDLSSLSCVSYSFKFDDIHTTHVGLIAQNVKEIIPEAVHLNTDGYYSIEYNALVAVLINKINYLEKEINELKTKI